MEDAKAMVTDEEVSFDYEAEYNRLYDKWTKERQKRREAERMCAVYASMATWGGVVMLTLTVMMYFMIK